MKGPQFLPKLWSSKQLRLSRRCRGWLLRLEWSRDLESRLFLPQHACGFWQNTPENDMQTDISTSYQHFTTVLMSVCVKCVTDLKTIHKTVEGQFLSWVLFFIYFHFLFLPPSLSPPPAFLALSKELKEYLIFISLILLIDINQRQTPCKQAGAVLQQERSTSQYKHASEQRQFNNQPPQSTRASRVPSLLYLWLAGPCRVIGGWVVGYSYASPIFPFCHVPISLYSLRLRH